MKEINIFYSKIVEGAPNSENYLLKKLPQNLLIKSKIYKNWIDKESNLLGKLLLLKGLMFYHIDPKCLNNLKYNKYGKPSLELDFDLDFNITHSGEYVICALGKGLRLGIDIEKIELLNIDSTIGVFTKRELFHINSFKEKGKIFYDYWTKKESFAKAIGIGLSIPLEEIEIYKSQELFYDNNKWYIQKIHIDDLYSSHITSNYKNVKLNYFQIDFYENIKIL